ALMFKLENTSPYPIGGALSQTKRKKSSVHPKTTSNNEWKDSVYLICQGLSRMLSKRPANFTFRICGSILSV
ncbi:hypothetical protein, partial [Oceanobacillus saliphilus]|uniref:hypothetical protein n=1 Tax=Oceanobacillus saliphilus TaxID=2925834 RepID=UPI00201E2E03